MMARKRELTLLPPGVRVYIGEESRAKRSFLTDVFELARREGFVELDLPTLDYYDSMIKGVSKNLARRTYQFQDDEGERLALRPDATAQVAKILSGRFSPEELPGKYCYSCRSYRAFELRRGEQREFQQFGAEIISADQKKSDLELLIFLFNSLEEVKIDKFVLDLGHVQVYQGLLEETDINSTERRRIWKEMYHKNEKALADIVEKLAIPELQKEILLDLPGLYGGAEVLDKAEKIKKQSPTARRALDHLSFLYDELCSAGYGDWISLDLSVVRDLDYYTGIVFEGLVSGFGRPLVGGGRYDNLYANYGAAHSATGFALEIDRLLPLLQQ
ncbi:MAG: ATP phosphoribosyltransferase regulatory subunit [bacterium]